MDACLYNVGYENFDKLNPGEEFKPLQEFDEFSDDDYYQDIPNSYVYELFGVLGDLDYEGYICMFDYAPFEGFGTSVSTIFLNDFSVYPNPTEGLITVLAKNIELNNLKLTNLLGQQCPINTLNISTYKIVIDLNGLESGIYYLTIQDEMFANFKIVKL